MDSKNVLHQEMSRIVNAVRHYFEGRRNGESIQGLHQNIHQLRVHLQQLITNHFLSLPLTQAKKFRLALTDQLLSILNGFNKSCSEEETIHHRYCVKEIISCFEWAEQIKEEIPDDPATQRVLAVDIPILRPFDYGIPKQKKVPRPLPKKD